MLGNLIVTMPIVILGPGIELPIGDGEVAFWVFDEDWTGVSKPDAVCGPLVKVQASHIGSGATEQASDASLGIRVVYEDVHIFHLREMADNLAIDPRNGLKLAGPVLGVVRPGDPSGGVRSPFSRHAIVELAWCLQHSPFSVLGFCCSQFEDCLADAEIWIGQTTHLYFSLKTK